MTQIANEWHLQVENGDIFVRHLVAPRFAVQIIIHGDTECTGLDFKAKWDDFSGEKLEWYMKAVEFYNYANSQLSQKNA